MSQYYTVRMVRKQVISTYDTKGKKTGETVHELPQVFHDLPHATALAYREKFPDAKVEIERQAGLSGKGPEIGSQRGSWTGQKRAAGGKKSAPAPKTAAEPKNQHTGTYGALVNAMGDAQ